MTAVRVGISLIVAAGLFVMLRRKKPKQSAVTGLLAAYIAVILIITLVLRDFTRYRIMELNPFLAYARAIRAVRRGWNTGGWETAIRNLGWHLRRLIDNGLNTLLFVPFGYLLPLRSGRFRRWWKVLLAGFGFSLLIEIIQLAARRGWFDTADIFHNTIGALAGFWIWRKWLRESVKTEETQNMSSI